MKTTDKGRSGFAQLRQKFPKISEAKIKKRIFIGPQIKQLFKDKHFSTKLNSSEIKAWNVFKNICKNFLSNEIVKNYSEVMQELISSYSAKGSLSLKLQFLHSNVDSFLKNGSYLQRPW